MIKRRLTLSLFVLLLSAVNLNAAQKPPNIVVILADDLGYGSANCYGADLCHIRTPNIDQMASEGIRFTQALAGAPVCAPLRCTLMTGKHMGHASVTGNGGRLKKEDVTVAMLLKKAGYKTCMVGKWGLVGWLLLFFAAFNLLEASLPSLISKIAPADAKGTAMGVYSTSQFGGAFVGGLLGGWVHQQFGLIAVFQAGALRVLEVVQQASRGGKRGRSIAQAESVE